MSLCRTRTNIRPSAVGVCLKPFSIPPCALRRGHSWLPFKDMSLDMPSQSMRTVLCSPPVQRLGQKSRRRSGPSPLLWFSKVHLWPTNPTHSYSFPDQFRREKRGLERNKGRQGVQGLTKGLYEDPRERWRLGGAPFKGQPQITKADGDAPVQAHIASLPGWKSDPGRRLDDLIVRTVR